MDVSNVLWFVHKCCGLFGNFTIICWSSIRNSGYKYVSASTGIPCFSGLPVSAAQRSMVLLKVGSASSRNIFMSSSAPSIMRQSSSSAPSDVCANRHKYVDVYFMYESITSVFKHS